MLGWIVNASVEAYTHEEDREQPACFYLGSKPVFEVWFWHAVLKRWFCMSCKPDLVLQAQGVSYFHPADRGEPKRSIAALGGDPHYSRRARP